MALAYTIDGFSSLLLGIAKISSDINFIKITTAPPLGAVILYYLMVFFFFSETRYILHRKNKLFELSIIETFLILIGTAGPYFLKFTNSINPFDYGVATVTFLDVGQGDCIHIHKGSLDILIDGGGNYYSNIGEKTLKPYFQRNGIKDIDLAIITHNDIDHAKGINELNEIFTIKSIVDNKMIYGNSLKNENDNCIVSELEIEGLKFLFMADADIKRENYLLDNGKIGDCDILKVGHHGSATSTGERLIKETAPSFAVISVGENNNYGHPTARVLDLLERNDIEYARTDIYGAICLKKTTNEYYIFENARKDKTWKIFKKVQ